MGREKRNLPPTVAGGPKERHKRSQRSQYDPKAPMPEGFVAKPAIPKSKHHSYFELVQNKDKRKKKLEFEVTTKSTPPPGFEFVPIGNPKLTTACKELSREKEAMIFIVSTTKEVDPNHLSHHIHRTGHHVRQAIVEEAMASLADLPDVMVMTNGDPEPLPESQEEYTAQADATIRDLFPRIPNTDRQAILVHAFNLASVKQKPKPVGLVTEIPLSRRVQLAVLAHIRHNHTRYDELLKETTWQNARKVVEALCLDILVKWRGDEETGRDQLDEILREVVVISDSEEDSDSDEETDDSSIEDVNTSGNRPPEVLLRPQPERREMIPESLPFPIQNPQDSVPQMLAEPFYGNATPIHPRAPGRREHRGFRRYRAWEEAIRRNRGELPEAPFVESARRVPTHGTQSFSSPYHAAGSSSRVLTDGGIVPFPNGFVQHHPRRSGSLVLDPLPIGRLSSPGHRAFENVMSAGREQSPKQPSLSRHVTPVTNRLQDMLVKSIEPRSPDNVPPAFVRTLPPRSQPSPMRHNEVYRLDFPPVSHDERSRDIVYYTQRQEAPIYQPQEPLARHDFGTLERQIPPSHNRWNPSYPVQQSSSQHPYPPPEHFTQHPGPIVNNASRRILLDAPRPGERSNPILMEDRGGFYERVRALPVPENGIPRALESETGHSRWAPREIRNIQEPTRVVSWEEGPRIQREQRPIREVEVIPNSTEARNYQGLRREPHLPAVPFGSRLSNTFDTAQMPPHDRPVTQEVFSRGPESYAGRYLSRPEIHCTDRPGIGTLPNQLPIPRHNFGDYDRMPVDHRRSGAPSNPQPIRRQDNVVILE